MPKSKTKKASDTAAELPPIARVAPPKHDSKRDAEYKWAAAMREWVDKHVNPALARWLAARPGAFALLLLLREHELWHKVPGQHGVRVLKTPAWRALVSTLKDPGWQGVLEIEKGGKRTYGLLDGWGDGKSGIATSLVEILGIDVPAEPPKLDQFLPPPSPAPSLASPTAATAKTGPKRRTKTVLPGEDDELGQMGGGDVRDEDDL